MNRSTKRVVGWSTGVAVGVVLILLSCVLILAINSGPVKSGVGSDDALKLDLVEAEGH